MDPINNNIDINKIPDTISGGLNNLQDPGPLPAPEIVPEPSIQQPQNGGQRFSQAQQQIQEKDNAGDIAKQFANALSNAGNMSPEKYPGATPEPYNAGASGTNFARYYKSPAFSKLGYSPWRDNETYYNEHSSWLADTGRAMWQFTGLVAGGLTGLFKSAFSPPLEPDIDQAKEQERAMNIARSTRGGPLAWTSNLVTSLGYTIGNIEAFTLAELSLAALTGLAPEVAPETGTEMTTAAIEEGSILSKSLPILEGSVETLNGVNDASKIKNFYQYVKTGVKSVSEFTLPKMAEFGLDTRKSYLFGKNALKLGTAESLNRLVTMARMAKGFGAFARDASELNMTLCGAKLMGGSAQLQSEKELTDEYYKDHGRWPIGKDLDNIKEDAYNAGRAVTLASTAGFWISNKIIFKTMFKGFPDAPVLPEEMTEGAPAKMVTNSSWLKTGGNPIDVVEQGFLKNLAKFYPKQLFKEPGKAGMSLLRSTLAYGTKELTGGAQMIYQDAMSDGIRRYYQSKFDDPYHIGELSMTAEIGDAFGREMVSAQGFDSFLSGFFMGALMQPFQLLNKAILNPKRWTDRKGYLEDKTNMRQNTQELANAMNDLIKNAPYNYNLVKERVMNARTTSEALDQAISDQDRKAAFDAKDQTAIDHWHTVLKSGHYGIVNDFLKSMKGLSDEDLALAFNETQDNTGKPDGPKLRERLNDFIDTGNRIKDMYTKFEGRYANLFDPSTVNRKNNPIQFAKLMQSHNEYEEIKKISFYNNYYTMATSKRLLEMSRSVDDMMTKQNIPAYDVQVLLANSLVSGKNIDLMHNEIATLRSEVATYSAEEATPEQRKLGEQKAKKLELLIDVRDKINDFRVQNQIDAIHGLSEIHQEPESDISKVQRGHDASFINKKGETIEGKVAGKKDGKINIVYTNKQGKKSYKLVSLEDAKVKAPKVAEEESDFQVSQRELHDSLKDYLTHLNGGSPIEAESMRKTYEIVRDWYRNSLELQGFMDNTIKLNDPKIFLSVYNRVHDIIQGIQQNSKVRIANAYEVFKGYQLQNTFMSKLADINIFFHPDEVKGFTENNIEPTKYYDAVNKEEVTQFTNPSKYAQIRALVDEYEKEKSLTLTNKPIPEAEELMNSYAKSPDDTRTIEELGKQFNLDAKGNGTVLVHDLLKEIINSKYTTDVLRYLASRLVDVIPNNTSVEFKSNQSVAGQLSPTGIIMDLRYTSSEFGKGGVPAEYAIMKYLMLSEVSTRLNTDKEFSSKIDELRSIADSHVKDKGYENIRGIRDNREFITEAMTNPEFQKILAEVKLNEKVETNSLWKDFVNAVMDLVTKIFKTSFRSTLLEKAINVITTPGAKPEPTEVKPNKGTEVVAKTQDIYPTKVSEIKDDRLLRELSEASGIKDLTNPEDIKKLEDYMHSTGGTTIIERYYKEAKPETKSEVKPEVKSETKSEVKPEPESTEEVNPETPEEVKEPVEEKPKTYPEEIMDKFRKLPTLANLNWWRNEMTQGKTMDKLTDEEKFNLTSAMRDIVINERAKALFEYNAILPEDERNPISVWTGDQEGTILSWEGNKITVGFHSDDLNDLGYKTKVIDSTQIDKIKYKGQESTLTPYERPVEITPEEATAAETKYQDIHNNTTMGDMDMNDTEPDKPMTKEELDALQKQIEEAKKNCK